MILWYTTNTWNWFLVDRIQCKFCLHIILLQLFRRAQYIPPRFFNLTHNCVLGSNKRCIELILIRWLPKPRPLISFFRAFWEGKVLHLPFVHLILNHLKFNIINKYKYKLKWWQVWNIIIHHTWFFIVKRGIWIYKQTLSSINPLWYSHCQWPDNWLGYNNEKKTVPSEWEIQYEICYKPNYFSTSIWALFLYLLQQIADTFFNLAMSFFFSTIILLWYSLHYMCVFLP